MPGHQGIHRIARRARHLADDHAFLAQQAVDERRLPRVWPSDDGNPGFC
jgi:hypothetical protein